MDSASDEHESPAEEGPVARGPRPRSYKNRASEAWAQQHFENIRNEGHSRTHIGNAYNTYHITERHHGLQQEAQGLTLTEALAFPLMRYRHDAIAPAYEGSCEWLFQTIAYNRWCDQTLQDEHYGLLLITGSSGTGKSTIVKELLKRSYASRRNIKTISYFFDAKAGGLQSTAKGMYQSLLFQMVKDSPHLQTSPTSEMLRGYRSGEWPLERLKELFRDVISSLEHTSVACYIDAVDESQDDSGGGGSSEDILQDFEELAVFAYRNFLRINICISSRLLPNMQPRYSERLILDIETGHITGIHQWAFARLGLGDHDLRVTLAECVASSSCGDYRWAKELISALKKDGCFEDQLRLLDKLARMIQTTEVPRDRSRLENLQSSLAKRWTDSTQTRHISASFEPKAGSDAASSSGTYTTSEVIMQLLAQTLRLHELWPGTNKRTSSPGGPLMSRNDVQKLDIYNPPASEDTAKLARRSYTVPHQSSRPSGSRRTKAVSVEESDPAGVPSSSKWLPPVIAPEASSVAPKDRDGSESTARKDAQATRKAEMLYTSSETNDDTDAWFYNLRTLSHALLYEDPPQNPNRKLVRVAIIDSGLATTSDNAGLIVSEQVLRWISGGHVTYKDFTGDNSSYTDSTTDLHGTWCASLLMQTAPNAELYIANVVRRGEKHLRPDDVAAAVAWAIKNEVDIISMSLGWTYPHEKVDEQIDFAQTKGIHVFAAASADDNPTPESPMYPASERGVYCVYSCSGLGISSDFNPRSPRFEKTFMFPGEDVTILGVDHKPVQGVQKDSEGGVERRSGTSYATPIAAGTAAMILDLFRQEVTLPGMLTNIEMVLRRPKGMTAVLSAMSTETRDGYHYVFPWKLLDKSVQTSSEHTVDKTHKWHAFMLVFWQLKGTGLYPPRRS